MFQLYTICLFAGRSALKFMFTMYMIEKNKDFFFEQPKLKGTYRPSMMAMASHFMGLHVP